MEQTDKKISQMAPLQTVSGDEIVPVVKSGGNYSALVSQIVALARQTMVEAQAGKGLSANDFTDALKAKLEGLSNYDDTEVRALITAINGRLDTILGDGASTAIDTFNEIEAFLAGITDTQTLTGLLQEQKQTITNETDDKLAGKVDKVSGKGLSANDYTTDDKEKLSELPTAAELTDDLEKKLDKEKWDNRNRQFGYTGHYGMDGKFYTAPNYANSGLVPVNRNFDIEFAANVGGSVASVVFYTADKRFIKAVQIPQTLAQQVLPAADIPEDATFFIISTASPAQSYYRNGSTIEAREGAVSEAIQAAITAAVDEALIAEAKVAGATFNESTGFFELNTLTDITAEQMRSILKFGCFRFTSPKSGARSKNTTIKDLIRTNILVSSSDELRGFSTANGLCYDQHEMEVLVVGLPPQYEQIYAFSPKSIYTILTRCYKLHTIIGDIRLDKLETANEQAFVGCTALKNVRLKDIVKGLGISGAPLLSFESVACMVDNAKNTEAIPIKVHPIVYAKLTDEQADIMALLPENLLGGISNHSGGVTVIDGGIEITATRQYVRFNHSPHLVNKGLGKLTIACDVEGLGDGELIKLAVGATNDVPRPEWIISANGRAVFSFDTSAYSNDSTSSNSFLLYDNRDSFNGQSVKLTNFKLSYGEHDALPYTPPLSSITDDATREKAEWLSLMQIAEARQINFVTTE